MRVAANELKKRSRVAETAVPKQKESHILPVFLERKNLTALSTSIELAATSSHQPAPVPCLSECLSPRPVYRNTPHWPRPGWRLPYLARRCRRKVPGCGCK